MTTNNKILIITTEGCAGCEIAINLTKKAIELSHKDIPLEIADCMDEKYKDLQRQYNISDYPTTLFIRNDDVISKFIGTSPVAQLVNAVKHFVKAG